jgi:cellobiose-specific phosphotransferase system component IIC
MIPLAMVTILSQVGAPLLVGDFVWGPPWTTPGAISGYLGGEIDPSAGNGLG